MEEQMEELMYGIGLQLEALRLEMRAASHRQRGNDDDAAAHLEVRADVLAAEAGSSLANPIRSSEARKG